MIDGNPFEAARMELLGKSQEDLSCLVSDRFDCDFPSDCLYAGGFPDRVWQFVLSHVRNVCDRSSQVGKDVWEALQDEGTAHNIERFALICGFFASDVLKAGHWPAHEVAALVLLIIATRPKANGAE